MKTGYVQYVVTFGKARQHRRNVPSVEFRHPSSKSRLRA